MADKDIKEIPIRNFVLCYNRQINDIQKAKYLKENVKMIIDYLPIENKSDLVESTIFVDGKYEHIYSYVDRYINYVLRVIDTYTNLQVKFSSGKEMYDQFDLLDQAGLVDILLNVIVPKKELTEIITFSNMCLDEIKMNK